MLYPASLPIFGHNPSFAKATEDVLPHATFAESAKLVHGFGLASSNPPSRTLRTLRETSLPHAKFAESAMLVHRA